MRCAGCMSEIEVGDRFIRDVPSGFMGREGDGLDGLMATLLGSAEGKVAFCEDCTQDGGDWQFETYLPKEGDR